MVDYNSVVRLLLKLFGVVLVVYGAVSAAAYVPILLTDTGTLPTGVFVSYMVPQATSLIFGGFLWLFPSRITNTIIRTDSESRDREQDWVPKLERIGVSLLGLFLLFRAISDLVYNMTLYLGERAVLLGSAGAAIKFRASLAVTVIQFILAIVLVLGSSGIVNVLGKLRSVRKR